ncbi:ABATE domain-containing protein [Streptomyces sp. NPDC093250]|uniref:ABATE domain-containing protein n=1 Tax=Streptomyces sp. NPDC093250 TaxID=3366036 RepID=UPI00380D14A8
MTGDARLALDLVLTIRHEGDGKVTDDLTGPAALAASVRARHDALPGAERHLPDAACLTAVRAFFAHAVRPAPAGPADANCLLSVPEALRRLNEAAARTPTVPVLTGDEDGDPLVPRRPVPDGADDLTAMLARAAIGFLTGPDRERLHACHAPRCVRYFLKEHLAATVPGWPATTSGSGGPGSRGGRRARAPVRRSGHVPWPHVVPPPP